MEAEDSLQPERSGREAKYRETEIFYKGIMPFA
jgi:hypothetical protein